MEKATVYFTKDISPDGLAKAYKALGVELPGKVAVKISTGEPGGHNFLQPALIKDCLLYTSLVAVAGSRVDKTVTHLERVCHRALAFGLVGYLKDAESGLGHDHPVVQLDGFHASLLSCGVLAQSAAATSMVPVRSPIASAPDTARPSS